METEPVDPSDVAQFRESGSAMTGQPDSTGDLAAWDAAAQAYAGLVGSGDTITLRFRQFLAQALGEPAGLEILDLGCGHGWLTGELARQGAG